MSHGSMAFNVYKATEKIKLSEEYLRNLNSFKDGVPGKRFGIDPNNIEVYDDTYLFRICWEVMDRWETVENGVIVEKEGFRVICKTAIVFDRYILVQKLSDEERENVMWFFREISLGRILPTPLKFDEILLDMAEKKAKKIKGLTLVVGKDGRAEKVKLSHSSKDLKKTEDFKVYMNENRTELKIVYGDRDTEWIILKKGAPGVLGFSLPERDRRTKLLMVRRVIEELIEPNVNTPTMQSILG